MISSYFLLPGNQGSKVLKKGKHRYFNKQGTLSSQNMILRGK